jgi:hypothetical protein
VIDQLADAELADRHDIVEVDGTPGIELLGDRAIEPATMGRPMSTATEHFLAASAAGRVAAQAVR